jgi:hypothetical protein
MEDMKDTAPCDEMPQQAMCNENPMREGHRKGLSRQRRKELMQLAENIAVQVQGLTEGRERCLLRRMVEMFIEN